MRVTNPSSSERGSAGSCLNVLIEYPSYLFNPSCVPNHMNPWRSWNEHITAAWESPCFTPRCSKRILCCAGASP